MRVGRLVHVAPVEMLAAGDEVELVPKEAEAFVEGQMQQEREHGDAG